MPVNLYFVKLSTVGWQHRRCIMFNEISCKYIDDMGSELDVPSYPISYSIKQVFYLQIDAMGFKLLKVRADTLEKQRRNQERNHCQAFTTKDLALDTDIDCR